ncbi:hypothetical protein JRQ81_007889 [Phrynocephalus forsythii]|uniref:SH2B adapter protein 3 n=1 Tax=Phrynocephalus forsythii TaxID=171643 RepID=A0A9Q0XCL9_9SAUR|nr:hypothetical protein JRQ81_007889 [Phrynocephalus forsythii]
MKSFGRDFHKEVRVFRVPAMNGPVADPAHGSGWSEFCEHHAVATARELARKYLLFLNENPQHEILAADNFSLQFADLFQQYFRNELKDNSAMNQLRILPSSRVKDYRETGRSHAGRAPAGTLGAKSDMELAGQVDRGPPEARPPGLPKSWSSEELTGTAPSLATRRHFSLTCLRRSWRNLFRRRSSEPPSPNGEMSDSVLRSSVARKIFPWALSREPPSRVRKEGTLKYWMVTEANVDSGTRWQRCRLVLHQEGPLDNENYVLALFDPPKSSRPKLQAACSSIQEIRRCSGLEMPDNLHTFVLKVNSSTDIIFEAGDDQQLSSWMSEIKECLPRGSRAADVDLASDSLSEILTGSPTSSVDSLNQGATQPSPPEQPCPKTDRFLSSFPWFHGPISRVKAAQLVQFQGPEGHGVFLIRQSETRRGEYVLTFNFQGRAKHLRLSLTERGQCRIQHLRFSSILDMLHHFQRCPIPLECGTACNVQLSSYVVVVSNTQGNSSITAPFPPAGHHYNPEFSLLRLSPPPFPRIHLPDDPQHHHLSSSSVEQIFHLVPSPEELAASLWHNGSRPASRHPPPAPRPWDGDYEADSQGRGHPRAVNNQYTSL